MVNFKSRKSITIHQKGCLHIKHEGDKIIFVFHNSRGGSIIKAVMENRRDIPTSH